LGGFTTVLGMFFDGSGCFWPWRQRGRLNWGLAAHPYLVSFLHRSMLVWLFSALTMVVVSLLTAPPPQYKITDNVFTSVAEQSLGGTGYRFWAGVLFVCTLILWAAFR
jgi:hypothetical protein